MDESERLTRLQEFLMEAYIQYVSSHKRKVGDAEFAKWLGVSVGSYNHWINGYRMPSYDNVIKLASRLGPEIFDICGYERLSVTGDPSIMFIVDNWRLLDSETRKQIIEHIEEELQKRPRRS